MILDVADWRDLERKLAEVKAVPKDVPRRLAYQRWAAEWGCKEYKPGADWQGWRKGAEAKFATRLKAAGLRKVKAAAEVIDVEAAPRELVDSPQRAPSASKARHTPPASQRSSGIDTFIAVARSAGLLRIGRALLCSNSMLERRSARPRETPRPRNTISVARR